MERREGGMRYRFKICGRVGAEGEAEIKSTCIPLYLSRDLAALRSMNDSEQL